MKIFLLFLLLLIQTHLQTVKPVPRPGEYEGTPIQIYKVKHGASYYEKWEPVFKNNKEQFVNFASDFLEIIKNDKMVPQFFLYYLKNFAYTYPYHHEMVQELQAISELSGFEFSDIFLFNLVYELFSHRDACTSVIIKNDKNEIFHGRNLDYGMMEQYAKIAIQFDYLDENNEQILYSTSQFVGYVVVHSGIRHGAYSVSLNQRSQGTKAENVESFILGGYPNEYLITETLKKVDNYEEAFQVFQNSRVIATSYYILGGIKENEGIIIEKERTGVYKTYELSEQDWYLVATNYDQDKLDVDSRMTEAKEKIKKIGRGITIEQLDQEVLQQYPMFNINTIETIMMSAQKSFINCTKWW